MTPCSISYRNVQRRGGGLILAAALLWSSLGVAGRFAFRAGVVPLEAAFYRAAISFACLLLLLAATNRRALRIRPRDLGLFAAFGLLGVAAFFVVYMIANAFIPKPDEKKPETKECPQCKEVIPVAATRCKACAQVV